METLVRICPKLGLFGITALFYRRIFGLQQDRCQNRHLSAPKVKSCFCMIIPALGDLQGSDYGMALDLVDQIEAGLVFYFRASGRFRPKDGAAPATREPGGLCRKQLGTKNSLSAAIRLNWPG
jgi:hypothetical protein